MVEVIMVIAITGIIAGVVASIMKVPVDGYAATVRRADMSEAADTALRRIAREIQGALPNSLYAPSQSCIQFIPIIGGGRYQLGVGAVEKNENYFDALTVEGNPDSSSGTLHVVINNRPPYQSPNAYEQPATEKNRVQISSPPPLGSRIYLVSSNKFPPPGSPFNRFQIIPNESVVFFCSGDGTLRRIPYELKKLSQCPSTGGQILARNVNCDPQHTAFRYEDDELMRNGLLSMRVRITDAASGESISLYREVHVDNLP